MGIKDTACVHMFNLSSLVLRLSLRFVQTKGTQQHSTKN